MLRVFVGKKGGVESACEMHCGAFSTLFFQCFANGGLGSHSDLEIITMQFVYRAFRD